MLSPAAQPSTQHYRSVCSNTNSLQNLSTTIEAGVSLDGILQNMQTDWTKSLNIFEESFMAMQQMITANQTALQEQMEQFLEFLEKQHKNNSTHVSRPSECNPTINTMYSCAAIYRYFLQHTALLRKLVTAGITVLEVKHNAAGQCSSTSTARWIHITVITIRRDRQKNYSPL